MFKSINKQLRDIFVIQSERDYFRYKLRNGCYNFKFENFVVIERNSANYRETIESSTLLSLGTVKFD